MPQVTDEQIRALEAEATEAGDTLLVTHCRRALSGNIIARATCAKAIRLAAGEATNDEPRTQRQRAQAWLTTLPPAPHSAADPDELLRWDAVMAWLGVSRSTLEQWRRYGTGPRFIRLAGGGVRYRRADVQAWLDALAETCRRKR